jgi:putative acetyltransferase
MTNPPTIRAAEVPQEPAVRALLETAFSRSESETRLLETLAAADPAHDPGLAIVAERGGVAAGFALFSPREFLIRGVELPLAILAPLAVAPAHQRAGVGSHLVRTGLAALADRGRLGFVTIGAPELFGALGHGAALDMRIVRAPASYLPEEDTESPWRALCGEDLSALCELQRANYQDISGTELRRPCAMDWEGIAADSFTLVLGAPGKPEAYLRFRRRDGLEITECAARDSAAVEAVLRLMRRLAREHTTPTITAQLSPPHPVALAMFHRGGMLERCNFGGAAFLAVHDWQMTFEALRPWWEPVLRARAPHALELELGGARVLLGDSRGASTPRLWVPQGWGASLLTGQRTAADLLFETTVRENSQLDAEAEGLVRALFTRCEAAWTYGPAHELADD